MTLTVPLKELSWVLIPCIDPSLSIGIECVYCTQYTLYCKHGNSTDELELRWLIKMSYILSHLNTTTQGDTGEKEKMIKGTVKEKFKEGIGWKL